MLFPKKIIFENLLQALPDKLYQIEALKFHYKTIRKLKTKKVTENYEINK